MEFLYNNEYRVVAKKTFLEYMKACPQAVEKMGVEKFEKELETAFY